MSEGDGGDYEGGETFLEKKRRVENEMVAAQRQLVAAREEHDGRARMLTEEEMAELPQPVSERRLAVALVQKLSRVAGAYVNAEEN